jgi:four helix bundle protein
VAENILTLKSKAFAVRIIKLYKHLCEDKKEYVLSKQILRSGTSIGANIREANFAQSKNDFISKMSISLKEVSETMYWLELMEETEYIPAEVANSLKEDARELLRILQASIITAKKNRDKELKK